MLNIRKDFKIVKDIKVMWKVGKLPGQRLKL